MQILITGGCGFVGSNLAIYLKKKIKNVRISTLDNLFRKGSDLNEKRLKKDIIKNYRIDILDYKKITKLPKFDLIIDCCAEPAIEMSSKDPDRVINTNLIGTFNILKKCVRDNAKIIFLSTSRVYSIESLRDLIKKQNIKKKIKLKFKINEEFSTFLPKSLYGFTKFCSEELIKEFNFSNNIDYIINRFGVISGPWQFGKQDQGFVSLWVNRYINKKNLSYIGFGGHGNQIRDVIHVDDVCEIIFKQIKKISIIKNKLFNIGGGPENSISLKDLSKICQTTTGNTIKFKKIKFTSIYDIPYYISDNRKVKKFYNWKPKKNIKTLVEDVYDWMMSNKQLINKYF
jgi:CDP-paratose 2-epimerase